MSKYPSDGESKQIHYSPTGQIDTDKLHMVDTHLPSLLLPSSLAHNCILFDLDGVLIDTRPVIAKALWYVAHALEVHSHSEDEFLAAAAMPTRKAVRNLFPQHTSALSLLKEGVKLYAHELSPCPGVVELLEICPREKIAIVTSRNQIEADFFLAHAGLKRFFSVVVTWGHTSRHKPFPDPLIRAAKRLGKAAGIYIGDTPIDMIAAKVGGFYPIGAVWASQWSSDQLIEAGAAFIADQPGVIFAHLQGKEA